MAEVLSVCFCEGSDQKILWVYLLIIEITRSLFEKAEMLSISFIVIRFCPLTKLIVRLSLTDGDVFISTGVLLIAEPKTPENNSTRDNETKSILIKIYILRKERDSNPRYAFTHTRFPGVPVQPLLHLSVICTQLHESSIVNLNLFQVLFIRPKLNSRFRNKFGMTNTQQL